MATMTEMVETAAGRDQVDGFLDQYNQVRRRQRIRHQGPDPRNCQVTAVVSAADYDEIMDWILIYQPDLTMDQLVSVLLARFAREQRDLEHAYKHMPTGGIRLQVDAAMTEPVRDAAVDSPRQETPDRVDGPF